MEIKKDTLGRLFITKHDVRDALVSAQASVSNGTETTLASGDSDYFLDIVEIAFANNSDAAVSVVLKNDGSTIRTFQVPANNTLVPPLETGIRQLTKNTPWRVDLPDITGTTISVDAVLIKAKQ